MSTIQYDKRVGAVAVYRGERVNCFDELPDGDDLLFYGRGVWNIDEWRVDSETIRNARTIYNLASQLAAERERAVKAEAERDQLKRELTEANEAIRWYHGCGTGDQPDFPDASVQPRYRFRSVARELFPAVRRALDRKPEEPKPALPISRAIVEPWLDKHETPNLDGPADGPRTILVSLEAAEELEAQIDAALVALDKPEEPK